MTWIKTVDVGEAEGDLAALYQSIGAARNGVAAVHLAQSLHPRAMRAHFDLYRAVVLSSRGLSRTMRERIAVVVSADNRCAYCVAHHREALGQLGDRATADELASGALPASLPAAERALLDWALKIGAVPRDTHASDIEKLRSLGWTDDQVLDAALAAAYFSFVNRLVLSLGVDVEANFERTCASDSPETSGRDGGDGG